MLRVQDEMCIWVSTCGNFFVIFRLDESSYHDTVFRIYRPPWRCPTAPSPDVWKRGGGVGGGGHGVGDKMASSRGVFDVKNKKTLPQVGSTIHCLKSQILPFKLQMNVCEGME